MFRKPSLLCCGGSLHLFGQWPVASALQPTYISPPQRKQPPIRQCSRGFAHAHDSYPFGLEHDMSWPSSPTFTPYDIFKLSKAEPYSKRRYYDLVKVYHPDRNSNDHPLCKNLPESMRLHRYRLIVAAHEILSDPVKREAYDRYGFGWHQRSELFAENMAKKLDVRYGRSTDVDDSIYRNATWEDWERWYRRHDQNQSQASTVSHSTFASFLVLLVLFGGLGRAVSIGNFPGSVEERVREVDKKCVKFLHGRRQQTIAEMNSLDARLQSFLIRRDPSGYGLKEDEEETYQKVFSPHKSSSALDIIDKPLPLPSPPLSQAAVEIKVADS
ncbi:hypothetical protein PABG_02243 [Paracoccidioides brasiliensis Pb03]|nr:hypothetical protein PABG_02243 [Paracoccidioides brasiliensis Pb03]ODH53529.1 hypothetical protein GX48_00362 [Paracoccidioides brasiliensis]